MMPKPPVFNSIARRFGPAPSGSASGSRSGERGS